MAVTRDIKQLLSIVYSSKITHYTIADFAQKMFQRDPINF